MEETKEKIKKLYLEGYGFQSISLKLNMKNGAVAKVLADLGLKRTAAESYALRKANGLHYSSIERKKWLSDVKK